MEEADSCNAAAIREVLETRMAERRHAQAAQDAVDAARERGKEADFANLRVAITAQTDL